jgi:transaldolase
MRVLLSSSLFGASLLRTLHAFVPAATRSSSSSCWSSACRREAGGAKVLVATALRAAAAAAAAAAVTAVSPDSQLAQLASMTTLSIDSGDLKVIQEFADTGYITDATTNPLFVSQAGLSGDPVYAQMVDSAVEYAQKESMSSEAETIALAIDRLAVNLGQAISEIVPGYISTEVDPRLSFNIPASVERGRRISKMYETLGVGKERVLIKLAATWEGIMAAHELETKYGIQCNLTLIFSVVQAMACAQYGAHLISPFPGRILDWNNAKLGRLNGVDDPFLDEGVMACREMYHYFRRHSYDTICMPASWRPSRGTSNPDYMLDEIRALAGTDRMTIPAPLLEKLAASTEPLPRQLAHPSQIEKEAKDNSPSPMTEQEFRFLLNMDGCGTDKLAEGIRAFVGETEKLERAISAKVKMANLV